MRVKVGDEFAFPLVLDMAAYVAGRGGGGQAETRGEGDVELAALKEQNGKHKPKHGATA